MSEFISLKSFQEKNMIKKTGYIKKEKRSGKVWSFIRFIRPEIIILGIVCVYIGALVAGSDLFSFKLFLGMSAVFCIGAGCHPFNDYFDYEIDKISHPKRPLPSGMFKPISGLYMGLIFFAMSFAFSSLINIYCFSINLIGITLIFFYEKSLKNKGLGGNIVVAFTVALSFMYGGAIVGDFFKPIFFTMITFFIFLGREIIMDVRDFEGDKKTRVTLPLIIGKKFTMYLASIMITISIIILFVPYFYGLFNIWYEILAIPLAIFTIYSTSLSLFDLKNVGKTAEMLRIAMILGLILFIIAIFM
jgi:geranylgeranylglycerol-phosphate geranylgeranyltransferase